MSDTTMAEERCVHLARRGDQWAVRVGESWTECDLQEAEGAATTINGGVAGAWLLGWGARGDGPLVRGTQARSGAGLGAGSLLGHTRVTDTELETFNRDFVKRHKVYRTDLSPSYTLDLLARLLGPAYLLHTFLQTPDSASVADQDEAELASITEEDEDSEAEDPTFECFEDDKKDDDEDDLQEEDSDSEYWETDSADLERSGSDSDEEIIKEDINETIEDEEDIDSKRKCDSDTNRSENNSKAGCSPTEEDKNTKRKYESGEEDDEIEDTKKARTNELEADDDEIDAIYQEDGITDSDIAENIENNLGMEHLLEDGGHTWNFGLHLTNVTPPELTILN